MPAIVIRGATIADAADISAIHVASWQTAYRSVIDAGYLETLIADRLPMWEGILADPAAPGDVFAAGSEGIVTGFCSIGPARSAPGTGQLFTIYLRPGTRERA